MVFDGGVILGAHYAHCPYFRHQPIHASSYVYIYAYIHVLNLPPKKITKLPKSAFTHKSRQIFLQTLTIRVHLGN